MVSGTPSGLEKCWPVQRKALVRSPCAVQNAGFLPLAVTAARRGDRPPRGPLQHIRSLVASFSFRAHLYLSALETHNPSNARDRCSLN